jgi:L-ascorbate metabolism protein UlaG (beta-lactamase superfamily)
MKLTRRSFLQSTTSTAASLAMPARWVRQPAAATKNAAQIQLVRHATLLVRYAGKTLLVDPMLSDPGTMPPIDRSPNPRRNPLVPLPIPAAKVVEGIDATLVTHTHPDHWDAAAQDLVPKMQPLFAQPHDLVRFADAGFRDVRPIDPSVSWEGLTITRTGGQHGRGPVAQRLAPVSGYILTHPEWPTIYIAGDTVWCVEVADAIHTHKPGVIVVNAGAAQFLEGGVITMDVEDVVNVCRAAPGATVIAVHMEAINHCVLTRARLREELEKSAATSPVLMPRDGEDLHVAAQPIGSPRRQASPRRPFRHEAGVTPVTFLNARQNAASDA